MTEIKWRTLKERHRDEVCRQVNGVDHGHASLEFLEDHWTELTLKQRNFVFDSYWPTEQFIKTHWFEFNEEQIKRLCEAPHGPLSDAFVDSFEPLLHFVNTHYPPRLKREKIKFLSEETLSNAEVEVVRPGTRAEWKKAL